MSHNKHRLHETSHRPSADHELKVGRPERRTPPKPKRKTVGWFPALVVAITLVGGAVFMTLISQPYSTSDAPLAADPTVKHELMLDANGIIETIEPLLAFEPSDDKFNLAPIMRPQGFDFLVSPEKNEDAQTISAELPTPVAQSNAAQLGLELSDRGMTETKLKGVEKVWSIASSATNYANEFAYCQISVFGVSESTHRLSIGCMNKTDYTKLAKEIEPFYRAYTKLISSQIAGSIAFSKPDIRPSATKGYQLAELDGRSVLNGVGTSGAQELFYRLPSGEWRYFSSAQSLLDCELFDSIDLKKAYLGEKCIGESGGVTSVTL